MGGGQCPSFLLMNINRLLTPSGHSKVGFLYDQAVRNNSLFVGVTETWLHEGVMDAEVSHSFPGYSLHRSDRLGGRQGGGVALYIRDDMSCDILASYAAVHHHPTNPHFRADQLRVSCRIYVVASLAINL